MYDSNRWTRSFRYNKKKKIDLILLDLQLPIFTGIEILNYLTQNKKEDYYNSIIVISGEPQMILEVRNNPLIYSYIQKGTDMENIVRQVNELSKTKINSIQINSQKRKNEILAKNKIVQELNKIGYNFKYEGTKYLAETIYTLFFLNNPKSKRLEKEIYPILSKKYGKTVNTIKCDIISATNQVNLDVEQTYIKDYFGHFFDTKISPKLVINTILSKMIY